MTWFKVSYDFERPFWKAYGHILYFEQDADNDADARARVLAGEAEPGAVLTRVTTTVATATQVEAHRQRVLRAERWMANVAAGIPNARKDL